MWSAQTTENPWDSQGFANVSNYNWLINRYGTIDIIYE